MQTKNTLHAIFWQRNKTIFDHGVYLMSVPNLEAFFTSMWADMTLALLTTLWNKTVPFYQPKTRRIIFYRACFTAVYYKLCLSFNLLCHPVRNAKNYEHLHDYMVKQATKDIRLTNVIWPSLRELHGPLICPDSMYLAKFRNLNITMSKYLSKMGHQIVVPHGRVTSKSFRKEDSTQFLFTGIPSTKDLPNNIFYDEICAFSSTGLAFSKSNLEFADF